MSANNIIMKKVWQDGDIIEMAIECSSNTIAAKTQVYMQVSQLNKLYEGLTLFLTDGIEGFSWISGEFGDDTTACTQFSFLYKDSQGHIVIEVTMELDDGGPLSKHTCCFFVYTELGALTSFRNQLALLISDSSSAFPVFLFEPSTN